MLNLYLTIRNWLESEEGQDLIEYALLVVFIALIVLLALEPVGDAVSGVFVDIETELTTGT
jgi:pilus assembly protein Flp/PilA